MRALIVEDEFTSRSLLLHMLFDFGIACDVAVDGREALTAIETAANAGTPYGLICLDIGLPEMTGREVLAQLRAAEAVRGVTPSEGATVIMTTAASDGKSVMKSFFSGCTAYLVKPIARDALWAELDRHGVLSGATDEPEAATPEEKPDPSVVRSFAEEYGADFAEDLLAGIIDEGKLCITGLEEAHSNADAEGMAKAAHRLVSSARNLGATHVAGLCASLEDLGKSGSTEGAGPEITRLDVAIDRFVQACRAEIRP